MSLGNTVCPGRSVWQKAQKVSYSWVSVVWLGLFHFQSKNKPRYLCCTNELSMSSSFKDLEKLAASCTCERGRMLGWFKASEENKNRCKEFLTSYLRDCKRTLNSYWLWNWKKKYSRAILVELSGKWQSYESEEKRSWWDSVRVWLSSLLGIASHSRCMIFNLSEHVNICKFEDLDTF